MCAVLGNVDVLFGILHKFNSRLYQMLAWETLRKTMNLCEGGLLRLSMHLIFDEDIKHKPQWLYLRLHDATTLAQLLW